MGNVAELYEALGVEMPAEPAPESENNQEAAGPGETGENVQEVAEPENDVEQDEPEEPTGEPEEKPEKKQMTKEERAENAKLRRQKEIDDAVSKAVKDAVEAEQKKTAERLTAFFNQAQIKNAHNGNTPITNLDEAEAWAQADRMAKASTNLKKGVLTPQDMQAMLEDSPAFKALQQKQAQQEQAAKAQSQQQFRQNVDLELAEIRKLNPKVNGLADILAMDTGKQWAAYVQKNGMSYLDAYKLANHDQLLQQAQQAAQAAVEVKKQSKSHLKADTARGQGAVDVPKGVKAMYREFMPEMTDAEIEADYRKRAQG